LQYSKKFKNGDDDMNVDMKVSLSKLFPLGVGEIRIGHYTLRAIPSSSSTVAEGVVSFENRFKSEKGEGSNPEEEARIVTRLLSLFWNSRIEETGLRIGNIEIPSAAARYSESYPQFYGRITWDRTDELINTIQSLDIDLARQYIRASHAYAFALEFIPSDPTFAFFLLVVAVECLSSQETVIPFSELHPDKYKCERFCRFIKDSLPAELKGEDERDEKLLSELLKTIYYSHRSGFAHGGKEVSIASVIADALNSSYIKHTVGGNIVRTPGLGWCAKIVRGALMGYLVSKQPMKLPVDSFLLSKLAFENAGLLLQVNKDVKAGQLIDIGKDINYR
jgi:hypothetical protein